MPMGEPDFVGVGAQHCGSAWWLERMAAHPHVDLPVIAHPDGNWFAPFAAGPMGAGDVARYHARFAHRPGAVTGEWAGRYLSDQWVAPLLARAAPDARILVILSDPIERYLTLLARADPDVNHMAAIAHQARYGSQLRHLLEWFDREQVVILQTERCRADPGGELARTLQAIGVDPAELPDDDLLRPPPPASPVEPWPDLAESLRSTFAPEVRLLEQLAGDELDLAWWPHVADLAVTR
jgi:hypothetical protein